MEKLLQAAQTQVEKVSSKKQQAAKQQTPVHSAARLLPKDYPVGYSFVFLMKLFKQSLNISSLSVFILSNVPHHATLQTEKTMQDNSSAVIDVITWFCPAEGALTALFGMLLCTD